MISYVPNAIQMYLTNIQRSRISFTAATGNQLDPSRSLSLLSMVLTINGNARGNNRRQVRTFIELIQFRDLGGIQFKIEHV